MKLLITGSAGFIGCHLAAYFLNQDATVVGIDNLSRRGSKFNLEWLNSMGGKKFIFYKEDIRNFENICNIFKEHEGLDLVIHQAAQVAVTTSVMNPREDFEVNALGTFNLLEATRLYAKNAIFEFASTNKVYGKMDEVGVIEKNGRYEYEHLVDGVSELQSLDFHSPYGCSKGTADQYVRDYGRIYGLKTFVLRQSCIYGTRQFGVEDQGWVAWFAIASMFDKNLTIYGDGKQGRDILWVEDLVRAYDYLYRNSDKIKDQIFNLGGGKQNVLSLLELVEILKDEGILRSTPNFSDWRPGDQKIFVCDINKINKETGWSPTISPRDGVSKIIKWLVENKNIIQETLR